jgi:signal transduction histidine kinase
MYAGVLGVAGVFLHGWGWAAALAMVAVAVAIEPIARSCERLANRLVFGQELTPRQAMRVLAERLEHPAASSELIELTRVLVAGTRCSAAEVWLVLDDALVLAAAQPEPRPERPRRIRLHAPIGDADDVFPGAQCVPVVHEGELIAVIVLSLPPGVQLPQAEARLVRELAGHAGLLVANARLTADLAREVELVQASTSELRRSREQLVEAQDTERRRLERDIHDGAQQDIVALLVELGMADREMAAHGALSADRLEQLRRGVSSARDAVNDLRHGSAPRILAAGGLVHALESMAQSAGRTGLVVDCDCGVRSRLPPETESAIYFCCLEALQNVQKHARASRAVVSVRRVDNDIVFSVTDDGTGLVPAASPGHSGLTHLAERVAALGGRLEIASLPGRGTSIRGQVPVARAVAGEVVQP